MSDIIVNIPSRSLIGQAWLCLQEILLCHKTQCYISYQLLKEVALIAILNTLSFTRKLLPLPYNIEAVAVKIVCRRPIIVCVLYIPPSANNNYHAS